ncbi:MAG: hypothetical protein NUW01_13570 [Gemmatimonadaceae bacterium]|nr:hypothetical protein [Gemmatimonadaceae bacterium]
MRSASSSSVLDWPQRNGQSSRLLLDADLLAVTTLQTKAQDASPTTIASTDYFLEPDNFAPPYDRIEIDISSSAAFESGATAQRSISVAGRWGYSEDTISAGTVASGLSASPATATSMVCSDGSLIDVGDTLLIESEQLFVSERSNAQVGTQLLNGALTAAKSGVSVTVDLGTQFKALEMIQVESERMFIESISGQVLTVIRAYDGSTLASHADDTAVHVFRTLTVQRGVNGTTAAVHDNSTAVSKYVPPLDIRRLCIAEALAGYQQERSSYGRSIGQGDGAVEFTGRALDAQRKYVVEHYQRMRIATI